MLSGDVVRRPASGHCRRISAKTRSVCQSFIKFVVTGATIASAVAAGFAGVALWQFADSRVDVARLEEDNQRRQECLVCDLGDFGSLRGKMPQMLRGSRRRSWKSGPPGWSKLRRGRGNHKRAYISLLLVCCCEVGYQLTNSPFGHHMALRPRGLNNKGLLSLSRPEVSRTPMHHKPLVYKRRQHRKLAFEVAKEPQSKQDFRVCGVGELYFVGPLRCVQNVKC